MISTQPDKFTIIAGHDLIAALDAETKARCVHTGAGYASEQLCAVQREHSGRGILGAEVVESIYGHSVRYDSGLQNFGLLARSRDIGGTLEAAEAWVRRWVAEDPARRYAWMRVARR